MSRDGYPYVGLVEVRRRWVASKVKREGLHQRGDRIVKYVPATPRKRARK